MNRQILQKLKPGISKRYLLLIAGFVWTLAGMMLFIRGALYVFQFSNFKVVRFLIAILFGLGFFRVLFKKISEKHIIIIRSIENENPCLFSFFNFKSYLIMGIMITMGILLRSSGSVNKDIVYTFYVGMGIPLLISAERFYLAWYKYRNK